MASSIARGALDKARYFLQQAEATEAAAHSENERLPFLANAEAAIVYGRSITFHLQKQFSHDPLFDEWYEGVRGRLRQDARFRYLLETRNVILKEGPAPIRRTIEITMNVSVSLGVTFDAVLVRGQPWYRRSLKILWDDFRVAALRRYRKWRHARDEVRRRRDAERERQLAQAPPTVQRFNFDSPELSGIPVLKLITEYLDALERVVSDAEARFLASGRNGQEG